MYFFQQLPGGILTYVFFSWSQTRQKLFYIFAIQVASREALTARIFRTKGWAISCVCRSPAPIHALYWSQLLYWLRGLTPAFAWLAVVGVRSGPLPRGIIIRKSDISQAFSLPHENIHRRRLVVSFAFEKLSAPMLRAHSYRERVAPTVLAPGSVIIIG